LAGVARGTMDSYLTGDVAEMLVYNRPLADEERQTIEKELAARWGIKLTSAVP